MLKQADVTLGQIPSECVGLEIANKLASTGFCVIAAGFEEGTVDQALAEIKEFDPEQRWQKVNSIVQDGLLGAEGSCSIAELESPDLDDETRSDGEVLMKLDHTMTHVGLMMEPYLCLLGFDVSHRSLAVVHRAGEPDESEDAAPLSEKQASKWLAQFLCHKLMVLVFLGPTAGTLELQPYETEDTEPHVAQTLFARSVVHRHKLLPERTPASAHACSGLATDPSRAGAQRLGRRPAAGDRGAVAGRLLL